MAKRKNLSAAEYAKLGAPKPANVSTSFWNAYQKDLKDQMAGKFKGGTSIWQGAQDLGSSLAAAVQKKRTWENAGKYAAAGELGVLGGAGAGMALGGLGGAGLGAAGAASGTEGFGLGSGILQGAMAGGGINALPATTAALGGATLAGVKGAQGLAKAGKGGGGGGGGGGGSTSKPKLTATQKAAAQLQQQTDAYTKALIAQGMTPQAAAKAVASYNAASILPPGLQQAAQTAGPNPLNAQLLWSTTMGPYMSGLEKQSQAVNNQLSQYENQSLNDPNIPANVKSVLQQFAPIDAANRQQGALAGQESMFGGLALDTILNAIQSEQGVQQQNLTEQQRVAALNSQQDMLALQSQYPGLSGGTSPASSGQFTPAQLAAYSQIK